MGAAFHLGMYLFLKYSNGALSSSGHTSKVLVIKSSREMAEILCWNSGLSASVSGLNIPILLIHSSYRTSPFLLVFSPNTSVYFVSIAIKAGLPSVSLQRPSELPYI